MSNQQITTIRTKHGKEQPYFLMARTTAQNEQLSWEARGVLAYLLSKPDDWQIQVSDLQQKCGRDKVYSILKELESAGYLTREQEQLEGGKFGGMTYRVYETPQKPLTEKPYTDLPYTENPPLHITENQQNTEKQFSPEGERAKATNRKEKRSKKNAVPATQMNPMKDAIFAAFKYASWNELTKAEAGVIQATAKELLEAGATPSDIPALYRYCASNYSNFSARALSTNWSKYRTTRKPAPATTAPPVTPPAPTPTEKLLARATRFVPQPIEENSNGSSTH